MTSEIELYKKALEREKLARQQAELILEEKVRDIHLVNEELCEANAKLKSQQKQLIRTEKLASLGVLSAGIAHEINNPLAFIKSNFTTLKRYFEAYQVSVNKDEVSTQEMRGKPLDFDFISKDTVLIFGEISEGMERVQDIVQELKSFARSKSSDRKLANPNDAFESAIKITYNQLKYKCSLGIKLGDIPEIECNVNELSQVFINMLMNAADAMDESGLIEIRSWFDGTLINFTIQDDGNGIPEEHLDQIFTPFFTAKPVGKGTGLGLSVSFGIIEDLGGNIEVETEVNKGTCFHITLPVQTGD